ncbi:MULTISPECIES: hypothetical protein [Burkholderia]|uniref:Uncharacterized protein n=1 Tax=Burkholderia pyrrocinia TaxID=60550 RepID=A0A318INN7_BURPY|nr:MULTISPECIES: hypothetical protein [Burkholderia]PXX37646.1 hypothetical protein NA66_1004294 [Burkholderia pyrrocinia]SFW35846.1 hypothetical protein SAMN03159384_01501 [Burkholderia sp. NFACC33-1]SFX90574.1 hypothetical protein SAMN03159408_02562 [Burkholderia sp. NFPP32]
MFGKQTPERLEQTIAALSHEQQVAEQSATAARGAYADALLEDGVGSPRVAALLREAGDARERADALRGALSVAQQRYDEAVAAEQAAARKSRRKDAARLAAVRADKMATVAAAAAALADAYSDLMQANTDLRVALDGAASIDMEAAHLGESQLAGDVRTELARLGCSWAALVPEPRLVESLDVKAKRIGAWLQTTLGAA